MTNEGSFFAVYFSLSFGTYYSNSEFLENLIRVIVPDHILMWASAQWVKGPGSSQGLLCSLELSRLFFFLYSHTKLNQKHSQSNSPSGSATGHWQKIYEIIKDTNVICILLNLCYLEKTEKYQLIIPPKWERFGALQICE